MVRQQTSLDGWKKLNIMSIKNKNSAGAGPRAGVWYAVAAFIAWGLLPLYWKLLVQVPAMEILAYRIVWSFLFVLAILALYGRWNDLKKTVSDRKKRRFIFLGGGLISANWFTYIWAVNNNHVVETSLGYYINPLLSVALGTLILKEKLNFWQSVSIPV